MSGRFEVCFGVESSFVCIDLELGHLYHGPPPLADTVTPLLNVNIIPKPPPHMLLLCSHPRRVLLAYANSDIFLAA